ncbi:hypothetical protein GN316_02960 [Xylophilus sp. Kf1]|nr:hypothetical protein [Xylophilus sp. Kf1]
MKIACLAWGSLLWKAGPLSLQTPWYDDGPVLPLEFCRVADGGELSTALCDGAPAQKAWWAILETGSVEEAREQLRKREDIDADHPEWIGSTPSGIQYPFADVIRQWMQAKPIDAVVWTALPPRYADVEGQVPDSAQSVEYLDRLSGETRDHAEDYVRCLPARFDSPTRQAITGKLRWTSYQAR